MRIFLGIPLPDYLSKQIQEIGKQYSSSREAEPHLTTLMPHHLRQGSKVELLVSDINLVASKILPFEISYGGIDNFDQKIYFINVERTKRLVGLHHKLYETVKSYLVPIDSPFLHMPNPHITVLRVLEKERGPTRLPNWSNLAGRFVCREVALYTEQEDRSWKKFVSFKLT